MMSNQDMTKEVPVRIEDVFLDDREDNGLVWANSE
jgi:hypothetical protein